jgi:hypothetical protein
MFDGRNEMPLPDWVSREYDFVNQPIPLTRKRLGPDAAQVLQVNATGVFPQNTSARPTHRFYLRIEWNTDLPTLGFICMNPSKALRAPENGAKLDSTILQLVWWSHLRRSAGAIEVANTLSVYETSLTQEGAAMDLREDNLRFVDLLLLRIGSPRLYLAWGPEDELYKAAAHEIEDRIRDGRQSVHCLGITRRGTPFHPSPRGKQCGQGGLMDFFQHKEFPRRRAARE